MPALQSAAKGLCRRDGAGIGADGILVLQADRNNDRDTHPLTIINSDASIADNCGNGLRCAASYLAEKDKFAGKVTSSAYSLVVGSRQFDCQFVNSQLGKRLVLVQMGRAEGDPPWADMTREQLRSLDSRFEKVEVCEIGNPHAVLLDEQANREWLLELGPRAQSVRNSDGINLHLAKEITADESEALCGFAVEEYWQAWSWERGAGETQACGSGASAVAHHVTASGLVSTQSWVSIDMPGGRLYVRKDTDGSLELAGPAKKVFAGSFEI